MDIVGTNSAMCIGSEVHNVANTSSVGKAQTGSEFAPIQPKLSLHSSSNRYLVSFPSRFRMIYNCSLHAPLT